LTKLAARIRKEKEERGENGREEGKGSEGGFLSPRFILLELLRFLYLHSNLRGGAPETRTPIRQ